ncbi:hypothetical protein EI94DRAFT_317566 [Lactarius quietus]|nr:hypothetical protein EI94DRAFT_317566 [Lactarius quietus]
MTSYWLAESYSFQKHQCFLFPTWHTLLAWIIRNSTSRVVRKHRTPKDSNSQNETKCLLSMFSATLEHLASFPKCAVEILIVDDGSPDYRKADIRVEQLERNHGKAGPCVTEYYTPPPTPSGGRRRVPVALGTPSSRPRTTTCCHCYL